MKIQNLKALSVEVVAIDSSIIIIPPLGIVYVQPVIIDQMPLEGGQAYYWAEVSVTPNGLLVQSAPAFAYSMGMILGLTFLAFSFMINLTKGIGGARVDY